MIYRVDEGVVGSGMGLFLIGGHCTVIQEVSTSTKFDICTVVGLNGTLVGDKIRKF
jgi:hypothetical protein